MRVRGLLTPCAIADPFGCDENFLISMLTLEELGATGNKVCTAASPWLQAASSVVGTPFGRASDFCVESNWQV